MSEVKIVILDAATIVRDGLPSLEPICILGQTKILPFTDDGEIANAIGDADAVICNKCQITEQVFEQCENLRYVGLFATGYNNIDLKAATKAKVVVCNVRGYSAYAVAQHTFALILDCFSHAHSYALAVENGDWIRQKLFSYFYIPTNELAGRTMGIVGFGDIGSQVAKIAQAFGMRVLACTRTPSRVGQGALAVPLEQLLRESDIVSLHCPLTTQNEKMINADTLKLMKKSALLVNTARGGLVDEYALAKALNEGKIAGACIDVLTHEPMREDCPLFKAKNCMTTPHVAWAPIETRERLIDEVAENIKCWKEGRSRNVVNLPNE